MSTHRRVSDRPKLGRDALNLKAIAPNEISYLAGYVDGEGCLVVACGSITIKVDSCYPKVCHRLFKLFGGRFRHIKRKATFTGRNRHYFSWTAHGERAYLAVSTLFPFLREKKDQAKLFLKAHHTKGVAEKDKINLKLKQLKRMVYL
jgi:hypothetical protein